MKDDYPQTGNPDKPDGARVLDLKEWSVKLKRGFRYRDPSCPHKHLIADEQDGTIECADCKKSVSPFVILMLWTQNWTALQMEVYRLKVRAWAMRKLLRDYKVRLRALKRLESHLWRGDMLPTCPHCHRGLMAEDFAEFGGATSKEMEIKRRQRDPAKTFR